MSKKYLRKAGEPRPIMVTIQDIAITFWCTSLLFLLIIVFFSPTVIDEGRIFYLFEADSFFLFLLLSITFSLLSIVYVCYAISKYHLNMWTDKLHPDWQGCIRVDKNGQVTNQIIKKDSLGYNKLIAFGKKAGIINRSGFKLNLPNGNTVIVAFDPMSHNADLLEALGWVLYKKRHGFIGYDAYVRYKKDKKELIKSETVKPVEVKKLGREKTA